MPRKKLENSDPEYIPGKKPKNTDLEYMPHKKPKKPKNPDLEYMPRKKTKKSKNRDLEYLPRKKSKIHSKKKKAHKKHKNRTKKRTIEVFLDEPFQDIYDPTKVYTENRARCPVVPWLENCLVQLNRKLCSLQHCKEKIVQPYRGIKIKRKRDGTHEKIPKGLGQESSSSEDEEFGLGDADTEKYYRFIDRSTRPKSFKGRTKKGFFNSVGVPSAVNHAIQKNIGKNLSFPNIIRETPKKMNLVGVKDVLNQQFSSVDEEQALALKLLSKVQRLRMKESSDVIYQEFLEMQGYKPRLIPRLGSDGTRN